HTSAVLVTQLVDSLYNKLVLSLLNNCAIVMYFFFQAEDGIRDSSVTGVQTCAFRSRAGVQRSKAQRPMAKKLSRRSRLTHPLAQIGRASCRGRGRGARVGGQQKAHGAV